MHEYDTALKKILTRPGSRLLRALTGCDSLRWLNVDLQKSSSLRVDLLGEAADRELVHIELQSQNEVMWPREGEYCFGVARKYGRFPRQIVLYVGEKPLRMKSTVSDSATGSGLDTGREESGGIRSGLWRLGRGR